MSKSHADSTPGVKASEFFRDAVREGCRGNHHKSLALCLTCFETTQMGFGILLSERVHAGHSACTEVLLQHWKSVCSNDAFVPYGHQEDSDTPGPCPAMWADPAVCQVLIDAGTDIEIEDEDGCTPLLRASMSGKFATVKLLVEAGARVSVADEDGQTCLTYATVYGHTQTVRYLVGLPGVDMSHRDNSYFGYTAMLMAAEKHADVLEVLIDAGADIEATNNTGMSPLLVASWFGNLRSVEVLLKAGAGVSVADNEGRTCLTLAAFNGHTETVPLLCMPEVDVNQSLGGCTPLHGAAAKNHSDVAQVLIDAGADIEARADGETPLHYACMGGALRVAQMLVEAGAVCELAECQGLASHNGHTEIVRYFAGLREVDVRHRNPRYHTALHYARQEQHAGVVRVLLKHGAGGKSK